MSLPPFHQGSISALSTRGPGAGRIDRKLDTLGCDLDDLAPTPNREGHVAARRRVIQRHRQLGLRMANHVS